MPQAVVLVTKRDRGLSCRGHHFHGPGEQRCYCAIKKEVLRVSMHPFLTCSPLLPTSCCIQHSSPAFNHDTRVHKFTWLSALLEDRWYFQHVLHMSTISVCLILSVPLLSPVPKVVPVLFSTEQRNTSVPQVYRVHTILP